MLEKKIKRNKNVSLIFLIVLLVCILLGAPFGILNLIFIIPFSIVFIYYRFLNSLEEFNNMRFYNVVVSDLEGKELNFYIFKNKFQPVDKYDKIVYKYLPMSNRLKTYFDIQVDVEGLETISINSELASILVGSHAYQSSFKGGK